MQCADESCSRFRQPKVLPDSVRTRWYPEISAKDSAAFAKETGMLRSPLHMLNRRSFLTNSAAAIAGTTLAAGGQARGADRPNVLLIMADDVGRECIGAYGGSAYSTPNIDRLARSGIRFTNCYSATLCGPSRVQLMTGLYPFRTGWTNNNWERPREQQVLDPHIANFARTLKSAGYATAVAGKWQLTRFDEHPDHARRIGFEESCLIDNDLKEVSYYWAPTLNVNTSLIRRRPSPGQLISHRSKMKPEIFGPDVTTDFLIDFIDRNRSRPFFAYSPFVLAHKPFQTTPDNKDIGLPEDDPQLFPGMVAYLDKLVGRMVRALEHLGIAEKTLVLVTSDNASPRSISSPFQGRTVTGGKGKPWDLGIGTPLIANWPGVIEPGINNQLVDFSDFHATLAELCHAELSAKTDGLSFAHQLFGKAGVNRQWIYVQHHRFRLVRTHAWKLIDDGQLYDMEQDPWEEHPIRPKKDDTRSAKAREELTRILDQLKS